MKTSKILVFVIAIAMLMSVMVMPVSAADVNLAGEITGITDNVISHTATVKASADASAPEWVVTTGASAVYADGVVSVTERTADASSGICLKNLGVESGKTYYISAQVKCDQAPASGSIYARFFMGDINKNENKAVIPTGITGVNETNTITKLVDVVSKTGWHTVGGMFTVGADDGTKELGLNLGIKVGQNSNATTFLYSIKDISVKEVKTFTGVAEAIGSTEAIFTFANNVKTADASNFAVTTTAEGASIPVVAVVTEGNTCTVSISDYSWNTDYTITASGINDVYGQTLTSPVSVTVTTPEKPDNLAGEITGITDNIIEHTAVVKASADASAPKWVVTNGASAVYADGVVSVTGRAADASSGIYLQNLGVESGKTYYISAQVKCDQAPASGSIYARFFMGDINKNENKAVIPTGITGVTETNTITKLVDVVSKTGWHTVGGMFTVGADDGTKELGLNLGIKVGQNSNATAFLYSIKDVSVKEVKAFTGVAEAIGSTEAIFTFANNVKTADASNFAVTTTAEGAVTPAIEVATDGNTCTVSLSYYSWNTDYTITANGVKDSYGQTLTSPVSVTITTPEKPDNLAGEITGITDNVVAHTAVVKAGAEAMAPEWIVTSGATAVYADGVVSVTERSASAASGIHLTNLGVESGKTYYISAQVRCGQAPESGSVNARFYMGDINKNDNKAVIPTGISGQTEENSITKNFDIVSKTGWQTVDGVFTVGADDGTKELGLNLGIKVGQNSNATSFLYSVKDIKVYELTALDIDSRYMAKIIKGENNAVTVYITGPDSTIYLAAAAYEGTTMTDVEFAQRNITNVVRTVSVAADENYKFMIWDSNLNPLCKAFSSSDI